VEHVDGGLVKLHERGVVELAETEELEDLPGGGIHTHDTADADDEGDLGLGLDEEVASRLGSAASTDERALLRAVLLDVLLGLLEDELPLVAAGLGSLSLALLEASGGGLLVVLLLEEGLGHGGHRGSAT
jgi:hypothetical protein